MLGANVKEQNLLGAVIGISEKHLAKNHRRLRAEINLPNGHRTHFISKSCMKEEAEKEILSFVTSIESHVGGPVLWRCAGDHVWRMGCSQKPKVSLKQRAKMWLEDFFELND